MLPAHVMWDPLWALRELSQEGRPFVSCECLQPPQIYGMSHVMTNRPLQITADMLRRASLGPGGQPLPKQRWAH